MHEAKQWAVHIHKSKQQNVVEFYSDDDDIDVLDILFLTQLEASSKRKHIRSIEETRIHHLGCDLVWAPIVGSSKVTGEQYKWESIATQELLNGNRTKRSII